MTETPQTQAGRRRVRALLLSDRIDTSNLERDGVVSTVPLTYRFGQDGLVTFRYGVAVLIGLAGAEEDEVLRSLTGRLVRRSSRARRKSPTSWSSRRRTIRFFPAARSR
jgi:hypothetical protein